MSETEIDAEVVDEVRRLPAVRAAEAMVVRGEVSAAEVAEQREKIRQVMESVMVKDVHYGTIPGVSKPTLLKPGAEVLAVTFRLAPSYRSERIFHEGSDHLTVISSATLTHIPTGFIVAEGEGLCTTREKKYAYRSEGRTCPACGSTAIKRSKYPPRENDYPGARKSDPPGWYCHAKVGGCGANFAHDDTSIVEQSGGRVDNPDLPETWNTVLKMANKRALVAAILNGTAASDIFTQDVEDLGRTAADNTEQSASDFDRSAAANGPGSWTEINAWAEPYGAHLGWREWLAQASTHLFGDVAFTDLTREQKNTLGQKASGAVIALREAADPAGFPPVTRDVVRKAWASVLDGALLEGPPWRMSPDEADRPVLEDPTGERAASQAEEEGPRSPTPPDGEPVETGAGNGGTHPGADTSGGEIADGEFVPMFDDEGPGYGG